MALQGYIQVSGKKYGIVEAEYSFNQRLDDTGKPQSRVTGGQIKIVMPASSDDDQFFYRWMFHETQVYSGILHFVVYAQDNKKVKKTVGFRNAFCVSMRDYFSNNDSKLMYSTITLQAEQIIIGMGSYDVAIFANDWQDIEDAEGADTSQQDNGEAKKA